MVSFRLDRLLGSTALCFGLLSGPASATAQYNPAQYNQSINVDCSSTASAPQTYQSITAALPALTDNSAIWVAPGTVCNESVNLSGFSHVGIYTDLGKTFTLTGNLSIQNSRSVYIYGINVTNPNGNGIDINNSDAVTIEDSSSSNNSGTGLSISTSNVTVNHLGSFDYNLGGGVNVNFNSSLSFAGWWPLNPHFEMMGNSGWGLRMDRSIVEFSGSTTISYTVPSVGGTFPDAFGIVGWGGAKGFLLAMTELTSLPAIRVAASSSPRPLSFRLAAVIPGRLTRSPFKAMVPMALTSSSVDRCR